MEEIMHIAGHVLEHSIEDTLYLIPFLFVTYLAMEWLEHKAGDKAQNAIKRAGKAGPVIGAVLGVVPQCGFSAAASTLYAGRVITVGTLIAVLLSTSDEMIPIFLAVRRWSWASSRALRSTVCFACSIVPKNIYASTSSASAIIATATANVTPARRIPSLPTRLKRTRNTITTMRALPS